MFVSDVVRSCDLLNLGLRCGELFRNILRTLLEEVPRNLSTSEQISANMHKLYNVQYTNTIAN